GNAFTEAISRSLGVGLLEAEGIKRSIGLADTADYPHLKTSLLPILTNLAAEIKNVLKFHAEHSSQPISRVLLAGGTAKLQHLAEFLAPELDNMKIEIADPWTNLNLVDPPLNRYESLSYTTAIGLA